MDQNTKKAMYVMMVTRREVLAQESKKLTTKNWTAKAFAKAQKIVLAKTDQRLRELGLLKNCNNCDADYTPLSIGDLGMCAGCRRDD